LSTRRLFKLERKHQPLLSRSAFAGRLTASFAAASAFITASLLAGMVGYHLLEAMAWIDAFANASMILSGMGPLGALQTTAGKLFAGCYALFSGLAFITLAGVVLAPFVHRAFHRFHLADDQAEKS